MGRSASRGLRFSGWAQRGKLTKSHRLLRSLLVGSRLLTTRREKSHSSQDPGANSSLLRGTGRYPMGRSWARIFPTILWPWETPPHTHTHKSIWLDTFNSSIIFPWSFEGKMRLGCGPPVSLYIWSLYGLAYVYRQPATPARDVRCL